MKPLVSAADIARYQSDATLALTGTCTLLRKTDADEGWGGQSSGYAAIATKVPCSVVGLIIGGSEQADQGSLKTITTYRINLPMSVALQHDITESDRIQTSSATYEIRALLSDPSTNLLPLTLPVRAEKIS